LPAKSPPPYVGGYSLADDLGGAAAPPYRVPPPHVGEYRLEDFCQRVDEIQLSLSREIALIQ